MVNQKSIVPKGFVVLADEFPKLVLALAIKYVGSSWPNISKSTENKLATFIRNNILFEWEKNKTFDDGLSSIYDKKPKPELPKATPKIIELINLIEADGKSISQIKSDLFQLIEHGKLDVFALNQNGHARRFSPVLYHLLIADRLYEFPEEGVHRLVLVRKRDIDAIVGSTLSATPTNKEGPSPKTSVNATQSSQPSLGRKPKSETKYSEIFAKFEEEYKNNLKFHHGEQAQIGREIADGVGYQPETISKILRPTYLELKRKNNSQH